MVISCRMGNGMVDPDDTVSNESPKIDMAQLMQIRLSRRGALKGMAAAGVYGLFGCATTTRLADAPLTFTESGRFLDQIHHVAPGYDVATLIRWGDAMHVGSPPFRPGAQTAAEQEQQFGDNNDFIAFMPLPRGSKSSVRGLLCVNHERNVPSLSWPGLTDQNYASRMTKEQCETEMASQGHSIVEIERSGSAWRVVPGSSYNRRITGRSALIRVAGRRRLTRAWSQGRTRRVRA